MLQMELEPASALIGQEATRHKGQCSQSIRAFVRAATQCCKVSQSALNFECDAQEELAEFRRTGKGYRKEMEGGFPMFPGEPPPGHPYPHAFAGHRS